MTWGAAAWSSHLAAEAERRHWWRGGGEAEQSKLGRVVIISESGSTLWVSGWWFGTCFSSIVGMMIQSDFYIFRGGWNHQLIRCIMGNSVYIDLHWYHDWLNYIYILPWKHHVLHGFFGELNGSYRDNHDNHVDAMGFRTANYTQPASTTRSYCLQTKNRALVKWMCC